MKFNSLIRFHHAGDISIKAEHQLGPRQINDYELVFFPTPSETLYQSEFTGESQINEPSVLITRPNEIHTYLFDKVNSTRHLFIHFDLHHEELIERYSILDSSCIRSVFRLNEESLIPVLMKQLLYSFHTQTPRWRSLAEMLFLSVLEEMESMVGEDHPVTQLNSIPLPIHAAMQYIDKNLENRFDIAELAHFSGWTHEHFTRTFQQYVGHPPRDWINKRRIERAAQLLLQSTDSAKQIAILMGFKDEYYFHRLFRKWMGMTSLEYRKRYGDPRLRELAPIEDLSRFYPSNHAFILDK